MSFEIPPPFRAIGIHPGQDVWIFAYGSLLWNPGFAFQERHLALVRGWHRAFCVYSFRHRGSRARPGAVLGLDRGGACRGMIYKVAAADAGPALSYLWDREMDGEVYSLRLVRALWSPVSDPARLDPGRPNLGEVQRETPAVAFAVRRGHEQYCGGLPTAQLAGLIRHGVGESGPNIDYLANTVRHLRALGVRDRRMEGLLAAVAGPGGL